MQRFIEEMVRATEMNRAGPRRPMKVGLPANGIPSAAAVRALSALRDSGVLGIQFKAERRERHQGQGNSTKPDVAT